MSLKFKRLNKNAILPKRGSKFAAGYDLYSVIDCRVEPWSKCAIPTGWAVKVPLGYYGRVASRSGLSVKNDLETGAGVIDADYRGEVCVILRNLSDVAFNVKTGDRIAQMIIEAITTPDPEEVDELDDTERGAAGFGSTGVSVTEEKSTTKPSTDLCTDCPTQSTEKTMADLQLSTPYKKPNNTDVTANT
jgi:dUTP pyrophosphatase